MISLKLAGLIDCRPPRLVRFAQNVRRLTEQDVGVLYRQVGAAASWRSESVVCTCLGEWKARVIAQLDDAEFSLILCSVDHLLCVF